MRLAALVAQVARVRATSKKTEKAALLAELLRQTSGRDTELLALFLTGTLRQGRIGLGWRGIESAFKTTDAMPAGEPLTLAELDAAFEALAGISGVGSNEKRREIVGALFARASEEERRFLAELLMGELRQGALEGVLLEAIAQAAGLPSDKVRDAAMFAENIGVVAKAALLEGASGLGRFSMRLLRPGGFLITCSCSYNVNEEMFETILHEASADSHTLVSIVEKRMQGRDHPVLIGVPETYYLKCFILRRLE